MAVVERDPREVAALLAGFSVLPVLYSTRRERCWGRVELPTAPPVSRLHLGLSVCLSVSSHPPN